MRDCVNVEVRDALPDLVHDRLPAAERERVLAHVGACADCAAELALLRGARSAVAAGAPAVDAAAIARAVQVRLATPAAPALRQARGGARPGRRPAFGDWRLRVAAALVLMAGGAAGVLVARGGRDLPAPSRPDTVVAAITPPSSAVDTPAAATPVPESAAVPRAAQRSAAAQRADLALGSSFSDLSDDELAAILEAVTGKDAKLPDADPGTGVVDVEGEGVL